MPEIQSPVWKRVGIGDSSRPIKSNFLNLSWNKTRWLITITKNWPCEVAQTYLTKTWVSPQHCINWLWWSTSITPEFRRIRSSGHPQLHNKFEASLGYMRCCLKRGVVWVWGGLQRAVQSAEASFSAENNFPQALWVSSQIIVKIQASWLLAASSFLGKVSLGCRSFHGHIYGPTIQKVPWSTNKQPPPCSYIQTPIVYLL